MKKYLLVVISLVYLLTFVACGTSTDIDTSPSKFIESVDISSHGSVSTATSSSNVYSKIPPHACYDKSENGGYIGGDGYCDLCNRSLLHSCYSQDGTCSDSNFDRLCDVCDVDLAHYCNDTNNDDKCDICFAYFGITHQDTTGDGYCDMHKKCKTYVLEHEHIDKNTDYQCDLCYLPF